MTAITPDLNDAPEFDDGHQAHHSLGWPEIVAITAFIAFVALLCSGALDAMLPWNGS